METPLCLGNISKDFSVDNMKKKTGLNGYVHAFSFDYDAVAVDDIVDIHKYLMEKSNIKRCLDLLKDVFSHKNFVQLHCIKCNNQDCKTRTKITNIKNNEPVCYPFSIKVNKRNGGCNSINNAYAKLCVPDAVKNINVKVFNLMSWSNLNKTRRKV